MSSKLRSESSWDLAIAQCCQEPIHIPGHIQPFGCLLATDENLDKITHVSGNLACMLGLTENQEDSTSFLGQDLYIVFSEHLIHKLRGVCGLPWISTQKERIGIHDIQGKAFDISVYFNGYRTIIELEPMSTNWKRSTNLMSRVNSLLQTLRNSDLLLNVLTEELRNTTGFDRVLAYQFLSDGSGEVVAEARSNDMEPLLGLRFPATDIPDSSRKLLLKTSLRMIPDIDAPPSILFAFDPDEDPLDLSLALMRGTSTIHTQQYLRSMKVQSSLTLGIVIEGQLWGLFALHHTQTKLISPELRTSLEFCGTLFSLHLQQTIAAEHFYTRKQAATVLAQTFSPLEPVSSSIKRGTNLNQSWEMLVIKALGKLGQLLGTDGLAFVANQTVLASYGQVPSETSITALINNLPLDQHEHSETGIVTVENFESLNLSGIKANSEELLPALDWGRSAGGGFFSLKYYENHYFVFFRNELSSEVTWAGNPHQQNVISTGKDIDLPFSPQRSFEQYQEIVKGQCRSWSRNDIAVMLEVKSELQNQVSLYLQQQHHLLVAELKHRVKNILAMIRSVARQTSRSKKSISEYVEHLEKRIAALGLAHELLSKHTGIEWISLKKLLKIELQPYLADESECSKQVKIVGSEVKLNSHFIPTFILVIHELVSNAVKYGALSVPEGKVTVNWFPEKDGARIKWQESNGPMVSSPQERGFGSELIERAIPYEFNGETTLRFPSTGVEVEFWLPGDLLEWIPSNLTPQSEELQKTVNIVDPIASKGKALIVEDNMLIAIELENTLKNLGFDQVDSSPNLKRAQKLLNKKQYSICFLDIDLKVETSFELAYTLQKEEIPFVFTTGYDSKHPIPNLLRSVTLLKKPLNMRKLQGAIDRLTNVSN